MSLQEIEIIVQATAGLIVLVGIIISARLLSKQIKHSYELEEDKYKNSIRNKSLSYSLYSSEHLRDSRLKVDSAFGPIFSIKEAIPIKEINAKLESDINADKNERPYDTNLYAAVLTLLAHWENMALSIDAGIADEDVCFEMVAGTLLQHVKIFRNFIEARREVNPRAYDHLMNLRRRWEERLDSLKRPQFSSISLNGKA